MNFLLLLSQVQWNLFSATSLDTDNTENKDGSRLASRIYIAWSDIENNFRKFGPQDEFSMRPRFYGLAMAELNNQDQPKLDGLVRCIYFSICRIIAFQR